MDVSGVLILNKPSGITSHDCVNKIRRIYGTKKVGHCGTLDPMADGVLPILIGRAAKAAELLLCEDKEYLAVLKLGITTDTEDTSGEVLTRCREIPDSERVFEVCRSFVGEIMQTPPMYSALKVGGKKLVDLARQGITVERQPRKITIFSIDAASTEKPDEYSLTVKCSKGTYIRTLCADIGAKLGCGGAMSALTRLKSGCFDLSDSVCFDRLEQMNEDELAKLLMPVESLFYDLPEVRPAPFFERLSRNGNEIYQKKIGTAFSVGTRVRLCGEKGFYAIGEVIDYPEGSAVKVIKLFEI